METFADATQVEVSIPLLDRGNDAIVASSVSYRVIDEAGVELVALVNSATFQAGDEFVSVTVPALKNALAIGAVRGIRSIELTCTVAGNKVQLSYVYLIESATPLVTGVNSFQTLEQAKLSALNIYHIDGWKAAPDDQRITALVEARAKIALLNLIGTTQNQRNVEYSPTSLLAMSQAQFLTLPTEFIQALRMAQVAEANDILSYLDSTSHKRNEGVMLDTIGEVKQMFRSTKPLDLPVCKTALGYLAKYTRFSVSTGRA